MQLQHLISDDQLAKLKSLAPSQVVSKKAKPEIKPIPRKDNKPVVVFKKRRTFTKDPQ